ncbi:MAG: glycosyltransferase family 39 protein [Caldilineales bacterium]
MAGKRWMAGARRWLPLAAVAVYLLLALPQLNLPGLHYDEAREAGLNALEMLRRQDVQAFRSAGVQIGPIFLPIMVQDYIGAINVYLALPFIVALGATATALRLLAVLAGLATLLLAWRLGNELGELAGNAQSWTGVIAALLLAFSPSFLFWSRQGIFVTNIVVTLAVATVWAAVRWQRTRRAGWLYTAAFLAGLGLWTKLLFVWVLGALVAVAIVIWAAGKIRSTGNEGKTGTIPGPQTPRPTHWLFAALFFLLGLAPLILFNVQTGGTLDAVFGNLGQSYYGVNNADFLANLGARAGQLATLLRGDHFWYLGGPFANPLAVPLAVGLVVATGVAAVTMLRKDGRARAGVVAPSPCPLPEGEGSEAQERGSEMGAAAVLGLALLFVALLVVQSSFTVSDLFVTHYAIVQPFVLLLVALALEVLLMAARGTDSSDTRRVWQAVAALGVLALGLWLAGDLGTDVRYHRALAETGGLASHSDAVRALAQWLDQEGVMQPVALDWGIDAPVRYLTENRVRPLEVFGYEDIDVPDAGFAARVDPVLSDATRLYVLHADGDTVFRGRRAALEQLAAQRGLVLEEIATFSERSGRPVFIVLRLRGADA